MKLHEVMTKDVEIIHPEDTLQTAAQKMRDRDIGFLPVCDGDRLIGVLSDRDLVVRALAHADVLAVEVERLAGAGHGPWDGLSVLVTAGGTREPIDPVRFVGNRSSGKMGYALAAAARARGAHVVLISGPTDIQAPQGVDLIRVTTAAEMRELSRFLRSVSVRKEH